MDPTDTRAQHFLQVIHNGIGEVLVARDPQAAVTEYRASEEIGQALLRLDASNVEWERGLAITTSGLARALSASGDRAGAVSKLQVARSRKR